MKCETANGSKRVIALEALLSDYVRLENAPTIEIRGLQLDSRKVCQGDLFVALHGGTSHGLEYLEQAVNKSAAAVIYDPDGASQWLPQSSAGIPLIPVENLGEELGNIADRFFECPSMTIEVIGITGTNGKTSCSHFLAEAMNPERKAGVLGTLGWGLPGQLHPTSHTTPDAIEIHRLLDSLRDEEFHLVAAEASSHGLVQGRLNGVRFRGALFTNFSRDHLDYHGTMEAYLEAKLLLLDWPSLEFVVFNAQDASAVKIIERIRPGLGVIGFCAEDSTCQYDVPLLTYHSVLQHPDGIRFVVVFGQQSATIEAPVFGDFNVENLTATLAVILSMGYQLPQAVAKLSRVYAVPGRMENFSYAGRSAVIDYAHTPDALRSVLATMRKHCSAHLWVVFGCGGDRDRGKRTEMGKIADQLADRLVITDDNPRNEDADSIVADIVSGVLDHKAVVIRDRQAAIRYALESFAVGDLVLIAGKGHENYQEIRGVKHHFSDREVVETILRQLDDCH